MANVDRPSGARPVNRDGSSYNGSVRKVQVDASNATAIFVGVFIAQEADGNYTPATAGATNVINGVCVGVVVDRTVAATEHPGYLPATTAGYIYMVPAESCYFAIQEDGDTTPLTAAARGARANFIAGSRYAWHNSLRVLLGPSSIFFPTPGPSVFPKTTIVKPRSKSHGRLENPDDLLKKSPNNEFHSIKS